MTSDPTNVSRLEAELCKHGFHDDGFGLPLHPNANDAGRKIYSEFMSMGFDTKDPTTEANIDFYDRYSEKAVRMVGHVHMDKLQALCDALKDNHRRSNSIQFEAIVSVRTAVAVCEALRNHDE